MAPPPFNLSEEHGIAELNKYLETRSYVEGFRPSGADSSLLCQIHACVDSKKYPHVSRWLNHISSFSSCQRASWSGDHCVAASSSSAAAAKPAPKKPAAKKADSDSEDEEPAPKKPAAKKAADSDDDGFDMSSEDDEETLAIIAKKNAEKEAKNKGKPAVIAKSSVILFVKPLEAETDMKVVAEKIKKEVVMDSLQWGDYELLPVAYGIMKLRIICVIEDDKVQLDDLTEAIEAMEEVQSVDIDAFNKL